MFIFRYLRIYFLKFYFINITLLLLAQFKESFSGFLRLNIIKTNCCFEKKNYCLSTYIKRLYSCFCFFELYMLLF